MMSRRIASLLIIGAVFGLWTPRANAQKIYWIQSAPELRIRRANLDGSDVEDLITTGLSDPRGIALDVKAGKMYWTERSPDRVRRANLDGSNIQNVIPTGLVEPEAIAVDVMRGKIYWSEDGKIARANVNGTLVEDVVMIPSTRVASGIAIDSVGEKLYWAIRNTVNRSNLDGSSAKTLVTVTIPGETISIETLALDLFRGKMYWGFFDFPGLAPTIQRANLDGSGLEDLIIVALASSIDVDVGNGLMYWAENFAASAIRRASLTGEDIEDVIAGVVARAIALDAPVPEIPALSSSGLFGLGSLLVLAGAVLVGCRSRSAVAHGVEGGAFGGNVLQVSLGKP